MLNVIIFIGISIDNLGLYIKAKFSNTISPKIRWMNLIGVKTIISGI